MLYSYISFFPAGLLGNADCIELAPHKKTHKLEKWKRVSFNQEAQ